MQHAAAKAEMNFMVAVGDASFAVALKDVREVLFIAELSQSSVVARAMAGYLNRRGEPLPVYHLGLLLMLPPTQVTLYDHILVVNTATHGFFGLLTNGVKRITQCPAADLIRLNMTQADALYSDFLLPEGASFVPVLALAKLDALITAGNNIPNNLQSNVDSNIQTIVPNAVPPLSPIRAA